MLRRWWELPEPEEPEQWPEEQFCALGIAGGWRWNVPIEFGGLGCDAQEMLVIYRRMAAASLVTTFILTQRNAASQRIELSPNAPLRKGLLTDLASGRIFATVGISHLTTSRQHVPIPAVSALPDSSGSGYWLNGVVPWASGAHRAQVLVTGGTLPDGRQILAAVPTDREGVCCGPSLRLMALSASQTGSIELNNVRVSDGEVLHGPMEHVMSHGAGGGAGSLGTSALAIGAAQGTIRMLKSDVELRPALAEFCTPLESEAETLMNELDAASAGKHPAGVSAVEQIRRRANGLATRAAQIWLATTKGAGYVAGHAAERRVRESMFFLVWSCPQPVLDANLRDLACGSPGRPADYFLSSFGATDFASSS